MRNRHDDQGLVLGQSPREHPRALYRNLSTCNWESIEYVYLTGSLAPILLLDPLSSRKAVFHVSLYF